MVVPSAMVNTSYWLDTSVRFTIVGAGIVVGVESGGAVSGTPGEAGVEVTGPPGLVVGGDGAAAGGEVVGTAPVPEPTGTGVVGGTGPVAPDEEPVVPEPEEPTPAPGTTPTPL